jgi:hypothetical protein
MNCEHPLLQRLALAARLEDRATGERERIVGLLVEVSLRGCPVKARRSSSTVTSNPRGANSSASASRSCQGNGGPAGRAKAWRTAPTAARTALEIG